jgi:hypothetical protein
MNAITDFIIYAYLIKIKHNLNTYIIKVSENNHYSISK